MNDKTIENQLRIDELHKLIDEEEKSIEEYNNDIDYIQSHIRRCVKRIDVMLNELEKLEGVE